MEDLKFRIAGQKDLLRIVEIYNSTVSSHRVTADTEPVSVSSRQSWFDAHNAEKYPLWVIEDLHNEVIGWASFQPFYGRPAYAGTAEVSVYLDESCRGKGIGERILQYCIEMAPLLNITTLLGFIFEHNKPSLALFEKKGFSRWGALPGIALLGDREYGLCILGRRV